MLEQTAKKAFCVLSFGSFSGYGNDTGDGTGYIGFSHGLSYGLSCGQL